MKISDPKKLKLLTVLKDYVGIFNENKSLTQEQVADITKRVYLGHSPLNTKESTAVRAWVKKNYFNIKEMLTEQEAQSTERKHSDNPEPSQDTVQGQPEIGDTADKDSPDKTLSQLYKKVINHLPSQIFDTWLDQLRMLQFDSEEKLQSVVDLVYEQAITEPSFIPKYARMCKELAMLRVFNPNKEKDEEEKLIDFRKLIMMRCEKEFENNFIDIEECEDPAMKKEIQQACIGFIAELFKQEMLSINILNRCVDHFLTQKDEESLEFLCKLLGSTGNDLESKGQNLDPYVKQMLDIVSGKVSSEISPRVRFMMQNIVELKMNKWIPGDDNGNHETQDRKVEMTHLDTEHDDSLMPNSSNVFTDASTTLTEYELMSSQINTTPERNRKRKRIDDDDEVRNFIPLQRLN